MNRMSMSTALAIALLMAPGLTATAADPIGPRLPSPPAPPRDPAEARERMEAAKNKRARKAAKRALIAARNAAKEVQP